MCSTLTLVGRIPVCMCKRVCKSAYYIFVWWQIYVCDTIYTHTWLYLGINREERRVPRNLIAREDRPYHSLPSLIGLSHSLSDWGLHSCHQWLRPSFLPSFFGIRGLCHSLASLFSITLCHDSLARRHFWIGSMEVHPRSYMHACVHASMFIHACIRACARVCVCTYMQKSGQHTKKVHGCVQNETNRIGQAS